MKTSILVGGQAVIEGVMMRVPGAYATALRLKNGKIIFKRFEFFSITEKYNLKNFFIVRGFIHLYESMKIGYQTLDWSAETYDEENNIKEIPINSIKDLNFISPCLNFFILLE